MADQESCSGRVEAASQIKAMLSLTTAASPVMTRLADKTMEISSAMAKKGRRLLVLDSVQTDGVVGCTSFIGVVEVALWWHCSLVSISKNMPAPMGSARTELGDFCLTYIIFGGSFAAAIREDDLGRNRSRRSKFRRYRNKRRLGDNMVFQLCSFDGRILVANLSVDSQE